MEDLFTIYDIITNCEKNCFLSYNVMDGRRYCKKLETYIEEDNFKLLKECNAMPNLKYRRKISFKFGDILKWNQLSESINSLKTFKVNESTEISISINDDILKANKNFILNFIYIENLYNEYTIKNNVYLSDNITISSGCIIEESTSIFDKVIIGTDSYIGRCSSIGYKSKIGDNSYIGSNCNIENYCYIGNQCSIGNHTVIRNNYNTNKINESYIEALKEISKTHIFEKWVRISDRSTAFFNSKKIIYNIGSIIEEPMALKSDLQCTHGLHVFRPGNRPEYFGLQSPHSFNYSMRLLVEVDIDDICFGGLPGNSDKLRVRKLRVLN